AYVNFCGNMPIVRWILPTQRLSGLPSEKVSGKYSLWTRETSQFIGFMVGSVPQSCLNLHTLLVIAYRLSRTFCIAPSGLLLGHVSYCEAKDAPRNGLTAIKSDTLRS